MLCHKKIADKKCREESLAKNAPQAAAKKNKKAQRQALAEKVIVEKTQQLVQERRLTLRAKEARDEALAEALAEAQVEKVQQQADARDPDYCPPRRKRHVSVEEAPNQYEGMDTNAAIAKRLKELAGTEQGLNRD
tara:strand:+ start:98 stop:502 length:405 start_codon:yes stop_codon:yes gene_type:complete